MLVIPSFIGGIKMYAVYVRQSVDRPDSISIQSQIDFCKYEVRDNHYKIYEDKGYSGKNTDRPKFKEMIKAIKDGVITKVVVYKLDRISRSILDFSNLIEMFQKYNVEFISSTEKFDTSTPMGRAMLNICIVFAQLERETIQKRVEDNIDNVKCKITNYIPKGLKTPKEALENEFYKIFSKYITKNP